MENKVEKNSICHALDPFWFLFDAWLFEFCLIIFDCKCDLLTSMKTGRFPLKGLLNVKQVVHVHIAAKYSIGSKNETGSS